MIKSDKSFICSIKNKGKFSCVYPQEKKHLTLSPRQKQMGLFGGEKDESMFYIMMPPLTGFASEASSPSTGY